MSYHIDLETYSECDLALGAFRYAEDPSTEILIAGVARGDEEPLLWVDPRFHSVLQPSPGVEELLAEVALSDEPIYAHNAQFEEAVLEQHGAPLGLGAIHQDRWRCTAAMGRKAGLRSKLAHLSEDLNLDSKKIKTNLVNFFCVPTPAGKRRMLQDYPDKARDFAEYCLQDVRAEQEITRRLAPFELKGRSLEVFQFTNRLNRRGIPVNIPALRNAQRIIEEVDLDTGARFFALTGLRHTQRDKVFQWLRARGYPGENMQAETVQEVMADIYQMQPEAVDALTLYSELAYAAAKKVTAMLAAVCSGGTVKGTLLYHGAGTGRWAGRGIQPQNFKKPTISGDLALAFAMISEGGSREALELTFGPALEVVASVIRNFIGLPAGLLDADYAAIEARVVNWIAGQDDVVKLFREGKDLYKRMGAIIYALPEEAIGKSSMERQLGKQAVLGCGYGMGPDKFLETCLDYGIQISPDLAKLAVTKYREAHPRVVRMWKDLDRAAKDCVASPGSWCPVASNPAVRFITTEISGMPYMLMRLPSGRTLAYPKPEVKRVWKEEWEEFAQELSYWGQLPGKSIMGRVKLYGGKLMENLVQAIAADLMAHGALTAEARGFDLFALIHDQALAANDPRGCAPFIAALTDLPAWAEGLPLKAEGDWAPYYRKD